MRITEIITEAVGPNHLYHVTTRQGILGMLRAGAIIPSNPKIQHGYGFGEVGEISLTRDPQYWAFDIADAQLILDKDAIKQHHKITQYGSHDEFEERVDKPIPFTNRFVKKVIFRDEPVSNWVKGKLRKLGIPFEDIEWEDPKKAYQQYR